VVEVNKLSMEFIVPLQTKLLESRDKMDIFEKENAYLKQDAMN